MGNTPFYKLGYLEVNQDLSQNIDLDELRFKTIDTQLYSLYQIFKNGIIEDTTDSISWQIQTYSDSKKLTTVTITSGKGNVSWKSAETTVSKDVILPVLPTGVTEVLVYLYAVENENTPVTKDVDFIASLTQITDTDNYISLGTVTINTTDNTITVSNENRQLISLFSSIANTINRHKHIGGSANPAPINLSTEVRGTLDGANISNISLSNVTSGTLDASRLPVIDHANLDNKGNLSHTQIDSILTNLLEADNTSKLSDLSIANRLQMLVALKKQSGFEYIDHNQINTIVYVPGIFPNQSTNSSTGTTANFKDSNIPASLISANVYDTGPWNSGLGISSAASDTVYVDTQSYNTKRDFTTAKDYNSSQNIGYFENIKISGTSDNSEDGYFQLSAPLNFKSLEQPVAGTFTTTSGWYRGINFTTTNSTSGIKVDTRLYSYKMFDNPIAMDDVSHIGIGMSVGLGETSAAIGQIYMYLVLGTTADPQLANDINVTFDSSQIYPSTAPTSLYLSSTDGIEVGYKIFDDSDATDIAGIGTAIYKMVSLANLFPSQNRTSVKGLGFYWSSAKGWNPEKRITFDLVTPTDVQVNPSPYNYDELQTERKSTVANSTASMFTWNESLYSSSGKFLIRFDSGNVNTVYNSLLWDVTKPANTLYSIETRTDTASSVFYSLSNIDETGDLYTGQVTPSANSGRYLDVLVSMNSDPTRANTPSINDLRIIFSTTGTGSTRVYDTLYSNFSSSQSGWESEKFYSNNVGYGVTYLEDGKAKNKLQIQSTSNIGSWVFLRKNSLISATTTDTEVVAEDGIDSSNLSNYLSPVQVFYKLTDTGFYNPKDFQLMDDGGRVFCDTDNDRVVIFDIDGNITKIIQGNVRLKQTEKDFVALNAYYNPSVRKIWVNFSQNISNIDLTKIYIVFDGNTIRLDDPRIDSASTGLFELLDDRSATLQIVFLSDEQGVALNSSLSNSRSKQIRLDQGSIQNNGFLVNSVGIGATTSVNFAATNASLTYFNSLTTSLSGTASTVQGIPFTAQNSSLSSDFNVDGTVPSVELLGPNNQKNEITLDLIQGPIFVRNIYNPISVHYSNSSIIIAQPFVNSVVSYIDDSVLTDKWTITSDIAEFIDTKLGNAYEVSTNKILIAVPSKSETDNSNLLIYRTTDQIIETRLSFSSYDVIKALPGPSQDLYYILTDDVLNSGENSRLRLINSSGNEISTWGDNNEIVHPKGLRVLSNSDILVSE